MDAKNLLEASGGGIQIRDSHDLAEKVVFFLKHPAAAAATGDRARWAIECQSGAARKHADVICRLLVSTEK